MTNASRLSTIPIDHVLAELAAFPLASESALRLNPQALDQKMEGVSGELWRATEREVFGSVPGFSIDDAVALRDRVWFARGTRVARVELHDYVRQLSGWFLQSRGDLAIPRLPPDESANGQIERTREPRAREAWRWLSFALPPNLLLGALTNQGQGPSRIALVSPALSHHLQDNGFGEVHLHFGASMDFSTLWVSLMRSIGEQARPREAFRSPGAGLMEGRTLGPWLIRTAVIRYILAAWLTNGQHVTLRQFLDVEAPQRLLSRIGLPAYLQLLSGVVELRNGKLSAGATTDEDFAEWKLLYREITRAYHKRFPSRLTEIQNADPIAGLFPNCETPEIGFLAAGLQRLERKPKDRLFAELFWQLVRVQSLFYRHVVQRPLTPGLQWFIRFYGRLSQPKKPMSASVLVETAATTCGLGQGLKSLEIRTSPADSQTEMLQLVKEVDQAAQGIRDIPERGKFEFGLVLHFTKDRGGGARYGQPEANSINSNADPTAGRNGGYRYAAYYAQRSRRAQALAAVLSRYPLANEIVRGVDICSDELAIPVWILRPLIRYVRSAADSGQQFLQRRAAVRVPPLRTTTHSGEDFVHLLTGLRQVDEAIERLEMREGDRIGHGLALGVDPEIWATRAGRLAITREQRLFDLVWQWSQPGCGDNDQGNVLSVDQQISQLSSRIFGKELTPFRLQTLVNDLHDEQRLEQVGFPWGFPHGDPRRDAYRGAETDTRDGLLYLYLCDVGVFERGQETIWIDPLSEATSLTLLQNQLRRKVGSRGIAVEVNPTSNLLIGDMGDLKSHPMWRLNSPLGNDIPPVAVCIGSDDPIVFTSRLREEYQLLADAMALAGLSDEQARQWLNRARICGLEYRFTLESRSGIELDDPAYVDINAEERLPPL